MDVRQAELTRGVSRDFVNELRIIAVIEEYEKGHILFRKGDPADYAYLMLIGSVQLKMGETGQVLHMVNRPGETFAWSSLVGRKTYSMTAECMKPTKLRKLHRKDLETLLEKDPANGLIYFKRLAAMLGERLLDSYAGYEKLFKNKSFV